MECITQFLHSYTSFVILAYHINKNKYYNELLITEHNSLIEHQQLVSGIVWLIL